MAAREVDPVLEKYAHLAAMYDQRWTFYVQETLGQTLKRLPIEGGERILDVGCGTGALLKALLIPAYGVSLWGVDPSASMLEIARERLGVAVGLVVGRGERLPFSSDQFSLVVSTNAFHYFRNPLEVLGEIWRVLRPGGKVVITNWCDDYVACRICDLVLRLFSSAHARTYGQADCQRILERAHFASVKVEAYKINWLWALMTANGKKRFIR